MNEEQGEGTTRTPYLNQPKGYSMLHEIYIRLPREAVAVPSLELSKARLDGTWRSLG